MRTYEQYLLAVSGRQIFFFINSINLNRQWHHHTDHSEHNTGRNHRFGQMLHIKKSSQGKSKFIYIAHLKNKP